jgi:Zn-dependent peptidase ImmA (M78 family)/transcriptional regulator with XRE-family HTH domain
MSRSLYGQRLRDARTIQRLKSKDVAADAKVAPSRLSRLERAYVTDVDDHVADGLARTLHFPVDYFSEPPTVDAAPGQIMFWARKTMPASEREQLHAYSRLIGEVLTLLAERLPMPRLKLPRLPACVSPATAAQTVRSALGIDADVAVHHLMRVVERAGVPVVVLELPTNLPHKHDAFSYWVGHDREWPLIVARSQSSWEKTRFSVAHELGHVVLHRPTSSDPGQLGEQEAHDFGCEFLLPGAVLKERWPGVPTLTSLLPLKADYGLSLSSLIEHAFRHGLVSVDRRQSFYKQLNSRREPMTGERWRQREPGWNDRTPERPRFIARAIEELFGTASRPVDLAPKLSGVPALYLNSVLSSQVWTASKEVEPTLASVVPISSRQRS